MRAIATVGAAASGKSTWTREFVQERAKLGERWVELNKDDLRVEILSMRGSAPEEMAAALKTWNYDPRGADQLEMTALLAARLLSAVESNAAGVVFSNTNLDGGAEARAMLSKAGVDPEALELKLFPIDFEECVRRDASRERDVGAAVLAVQFAKLHALGLGFPESPAAAPASKPKA